MQEALAAATRSGQRRSRLLRRRAVGARLAAGGLLLAAVALGGLVLALWPGTGPLDDWGFRLVDEVPASGAGALRWVALIGSAPVVAGGAAAGAAWHLVRPARAWPSRAWPARAWPARAWPGALACVAVPLVTGALTQLVVKPLVGRHLGSGLSYPSGHAGGAAALAVVLVLSVAPRWRRLAGALGGLVALCVSAAVVRLGWHYPTDALAGLALAAGLGLLADAVLLW
ncbi:MAG: phosphatase PAP2 family protein, partial [Acidimicrobiales bacterium]